MQQRFKMAREGQPVHDVVLLPTTRANPHKPHISVMAILGLEVNMISFVDTATAYKVAVLLLNSTHDEHAGVTSGGGYCSFHITPPALTAY